LSRALRTPFEHHIPQWSAITVYDVSTHLQLTSAEQRVRHLDAARANRAARLVRLRRLDRQAQQATTRARLVRLALN
jgi:hypothetical protein